MHVYFFISYMNECWIKIIKYLAHRLKWFYGIKYNQLFMYFVYLNQNLFKFISLKYCQTQDRWCDGS